jgi:hypothetical protein
MKGKVRIIGEEVAMDYFKALSGLSAKEIFEKH